MLKTSLRWIISLCRALPMFAAVALGSSSLVCPAATAEPPLVLTNHLGYERTGPKHAVIRGGADDHFTDFALKTYPEGRVVMQGKVSGGGPVDHWQDWRFWSLDFDALESEGDYLIECHDGDRLVRSWPFRVQDNLLERRTLGDVIFYFKGQRCSGALDRADRRMTFLGADRPPVDVHGGWYDASGDYGKHLSHLDYSTYHNPQQIPLVVYHLLKARDRLEQRGDVNFTQDRRRLLDEALFGADYLVRVKVPDGSFYETVANRGPAKKPEDRRITPMRRAAASSPGTPAAITTPDPYEVSYRGGGGMAIAALALASRAPAEGEFSPADYLRAAEAAFVYLEAHNRELTNDGRENIVDDYCALAGAAELFRANPKPAYADAARRRADNLLGRLVTTDSPANYWRADDGTRPFFHAADAGLPVVTLLFYRELAPAAMQARIDATVRRVLEGELKLTAEVANPFGLARQYVQNKAGQRRTTFFYPHDGDSAPWWQGENARLGSLAAAARLAAPLFADDPAFQQKLRSYAAHQLDWILGLNPFDACMLGGSGHNNPEYIFYRTYQYRNFAGGICNGITAALDDEHGIAFDWAAEVKTEDNDWRWGEQWLPHAAWYLLAVAEGAR
jgi:hypothetical protein